MEKHAKFFARAVITAVALIAVMLGLSDVLRYKNYINETSEFLNFYKLPQNTVDVLFLGTSHAREAFSPQQLYDDYGITSYNLASADQPPVLSYYWIKEALKTQHPKAVVFDVSMVLSYRGTELPEPNVRKGLDYMHFGLNKMLAIFALDRRYGGHSQRSYYLPIIRYHSRWKELNESDFLRDEYAAANDKMGYGRTFTDHSSFKYRPLKIGRTAINKLEVPDEYLEKTAEFCSQNGIKLILIKTPFPKWTIEKHASMKRFADSRACPFYDMNDENIYNAAGINYRADFSDRFGHANVSGAKKMTAYIGRLLKDEHGLLPHKSEAWEALHSRYVKLEDDDKLGGIDDLGTYAAALQKNMDHYTILVAVGGDASSLKSISSLKSLGLKADWKKNTGKSYYAVIENGSVLREEMSAECLSYTGSFCNGRRIYRIESAGRGAGSICSVIINGQEAAAENRYLNIVVFSNERQCVVDSKCFKAKRKKK